MIATSVTERITDIKLYGRTDGARAIQAPRSEDRALAYRGTGAQQVTALAITLSRSAVHATQCTLLTMR